MNPLNALKRRKKTTEAALQQFGRILKVAADKKKNTLYGKRTSIAQGIKALKGTKFRPGSLDF